MEVYSASFYTFFRSLPFSDFTNMTYKIEIFSRLYKDSTKDGKKLLVKKSRKLFRSTIFAVSSKYSH